MRPLRDGVDLEMVHALEDAAHPRNGVNLEMVHGVTWRATTNRLYVTGWQSRKVQEGVEQR